MIKIIIIVMIIIMIEKRIDIIIIIIMTRDFERILKIVFYRFLRILRGF